MNSQPELGVDDEPVRIDPYDRSWPVRFKEERQDLEKTLGNSITGGIHHVGSTAVPGLDAKPVIDILVGVDNLESSRAYIEPLAGLGYVYSPYRPDEMLWFCKPNPARRTHHLHLVPTDSPRFQAELAFRDYLRTHPGAAKEYAALKRRLAAQFAHDREAYTEAKADFIRKALEPAAGDGAGGSDP
jgi:GrpB-like predicted nucleotidyltransferase (UPF0157 family)